MDYDMRMRAWAIKGHVTKGDLMTLIYGKNYQGIDSAIPQDYADMHEMSYGHENPRQDIFFYCANYNTNRSGEIEYMPEIAEKKGIVV
jgi:hypothetical protein